VAILKHAGKLVWLLPLLLTGALYEGWAWWRVERYHRQIADPAGIVVTNETAPELIFAKADSLAASDRAESLRLYALLLRDGDADFRERVRYNLGTLYLQEAAQLWNARGVLEYARVNTLVAEAKEHLREALRLSPANWDARFNLEYACRITPPPKEKGKANFQGSKGSVFATLPSIPGGGP